MGMRDRRVLTAAIILKKRKKEKELHERENKEYPKKERIKRGTIKKREKNWRGKKRGRKMEDTYTVHVCICKIKTLNIKSILLYKLKTNLGSPERHSCSNFTKMSFSLAIMTPGNTFSCNE